MRQIGAQAVILLSALVPQATRRFLIGRWIATGRSVLSAQLFAGRVPDA